MSGDPYKAPPSVNIDPAAGPPSDERAWASRYEGADIPAGLPNNSTSVVLENARVVKSGSGSLYGFSGLSNLAAAQFIHVYDARAIPANGAVPQVIVPVLATSGFSADWTSRGRAFSAGIVIVCSTTLATLTIGAANCWFDAQYL